eukprot:ctg_979.g334
MRPVVLWYRGHDLRVTDNVALRAAAALGVPVLPVFVWDAESPWTSRPGRAGCWRLHRSLEELQGTLRARYGLQAQLAVRCGNVVDSLVQLVGESSASAVFFNRCYDGHALETDRVLEERLASQGVEVVGLKSELLLEPWEVLRDTNEPFNEFHPYMERWLAGEQPPPPSPPPEQLCLWTHWERLTDGVGALTDLHLLDDIDDAWRSALEREWPQAGETAAAQALEAFLRERYPDFDRRQARCSLHGTSRLSAFVRFGELSPRQLYRAVMAHVVPEEHVSARIRLPPPLLQSARQRAAAAARVPRLSLALGRPHRPGGVARRPHRLPGCGCGPAGAVAAGSALSVRPLDRWRCGLPGARLAMDRRLPYGRVSVCVHREPGQLRAQGGCTRRVRETLVAGAVPSAAAIRTLSVAGAIASAR